MVRATAQREGNVIFSFSVYSRGGKKFPTSQHSFPRVMGLVLNQHPGELCPLPYLHTLTVSCPFWLCLGSLWLRGS